MPPSRVTCSTIMALSPEVHEVSKADKAETDQNEPEETHRTCRQSGADQNDQSKNDESGAGRDIVLLAQTQTSLPGFLPLIQVAVNVSPQILCLLIGERATALDL